ncbi:hypothetical protein IJG79_01140 [Candidatus Saccharibacteria bacterium]|nr:hypothetical protein [Candidatus Saccharibacteria bacterium]
MSKKSTKIIAAAGVVAGLGVAALPALTFATSTVAGEVELTAEVNEAIAMTIKGNADPSSGEPAVQQPGVDVYTPTGATTIDGHPVGSLYDSTNLETSSSAVSLLPNAADTTTATSEIKVYTNAAAGFTLSVKDADTITALTHTDGESTIPAGATITAGTAAWGYKGGSVANFAAISATDAEVYTQSAPTSGGQTINMVYGVSTASDQKTGTYTDTIIYTATTN